MASVAQRIRWDMDAEQAAPERLRTGFKQENSALPGYHQYPERKG